jgi:hypothetical protein
VFGFVVLVQEGYGVKVFGGLGVGRGGDGWVAEEMEMDNSLDCMAISFLNISHLILHFNSFRLKQQPACITKVHKLVAQLLSPN